MENSDVRNMLLSELIDNMHSRLADKMFPPEPELKTTPASGETIVDVSATDLAPVGAPNPSDHGDDNGDAHGLDEEPTDEELEEMLK
jgi:hypothetical protein